MQTGVIDFFSQLFSTADFPARWHCGLWSPAHGWLHILSDLAVFGAYVTIPFLLIIFVRRRSETPFTGIFWLFSAFIISCGLTHLMEAIIFWAPAYRLAGVLKFSTAVVSWLTVFGLIRVMPGALQLKTPTELQAEVDRRTRDLQDQIRANELLLQELGRAREDFDRFAYSVSHDLRAPARAIGGFADILHEEYGDRLDDEGHRLLRVIGSNATTMGRQLDDLLRFSRLGRADLDRTTVDMRAVVTEVVDNWTANLTDRTIAFDIGELPEVSGDVGMMFRLWDNLVSNAVKYTAQVENARIEIRAEEGEETVRFSITDNGVGFDPAQKSKMFDVFERLHVDEEFEGTGVGLAIVEQIVQRHGGDVDATGAPEEGATVWFDLPRIDGDQSAGTG